MAIESERFKATLRSLKFCGTTIRDFALEVGVSENTLYNYMRGQQPALSYYQHIMSYIKKNYPKAQELADEQLTGGKNDF